MVDCNDIVEIGFLQIVLCCVYGFVVDVIVVNVYWFGWFDVYFSCLVDICLVECFEFVEKFESESVIQVWCLIKGYLYGFEQKGVVVVYWID